jgi:DNA-binding transcriptional regulator YiaG
MVLKTCEFCGSPVYVRPSLVAKGWGRFCNKTCRWEWARQQRGGKLQDHPTVHEFIRSELGDVVDAMTRDEAMIVLRHESEPVWSLQKIGDAFGVSRERVRQIAGTSRAALRKDAWTADEDRAVLDARLTVDDIAEVLPGRSACAVQNRRCKLGARTGWTDKEVQILRKNIHLTDVELGKLIGRSRDSVRGKRFAIGLRKRARKMWSPNEVEYLRENHGKMTFQEMGRVLGRSVSSLQSKWARLGG